LLTWKQGQSLENLIEYPNELEDVIEKWAPSLANPANRIGADKRWMAIKVLEQDEWITGKVQQAGALKTLEIQQALDRIEKTLKESADIVLADY